MTQRVFVKVVGFTDVERHALNAVFRLSEQSDTAYSLWAPDAPAQPRLALVDGLSYEAGLQLVSPGPEMTLIWVGPIPPAGAWRTFDRPIAWPGIIRAMDELFAAPDFDGGAADEVQDTLPPEPEAPPKRALIASADADERMYMRAKLALAEFSLADDALTGAQATELATAHRYTVALVDFSLPDVDGWVLLRQLLAARPGVAHIIITKADVSLADRLRGWFAGADAFFGKPPHPGRLHERLVKI